MPVRGRDRSVQRDTNARLTAMAGVLVQRRRRSHMDAGLSVHAMLCGNCEEVLNFVTGRSGSVLDVESPER